ncbi:Thimet oligopeptidase [Balamuthia mandrillaris]
MEQARQEHLNELRVLSADEITALADSIIAESKKVQDQIAALKEGEHTFENTFLALAYDDARCETLSANCYFPSYVHPSKAERDASTEANKKLEAFNIESNMREDVYKSLCAFRQKAKEQGIQLTPEDQRLIDKKMEGFERNGLGLPAEKREKLKEIKKRISELCIAYQRNLNEDKTTLEFSKEELNGLPDDFLEDLPKKEGAGPKGETLYVVSLKYPEYFPVVKQATNEETRKKMEYAFSTQCMTENIPILEEVLKLRHEAANLLGFQNHGDFILCIRMAKNVDTVRKFLQELQEKLLPFGQKELAKLLELKQEEKQDSSDGVINDWDFRYYHRMLLEKYYQVNDDEIKPYFPLDVVTKGLLDIYQELLGLRFERVERPSNIWHEDVSMYSVYDSESNDFMGHFYLDLFPREGKYTHAAAFPLQCTYLKPDGARQYPAAAMVANFTKPGKDKPSLLKHSEVVTYFHEFGHIMHNICSKVTYGMFSGTSVERDFVEAPSQMLENWCWEKEIIHRLSGHYKDGTPLPEQLVQNMIAAKNVNTGLLNLRQIFFSTFDNTIHTQPETDTASLWYKLRREVSLIKSTPGTNPAASFGHLMGGYDAQYYGYMYSEVFSADMYSRFKKEGILNPTIGKQYRDVILSRGGSVDSIDSLREFLGRDPTQDAFLEHIGLVAPPENAPQYV